MESLDGTSWEVLIAGTGLQESLLALALSRSDKKILHVDKNGYYGGPDAALSLQEAEEWCTSLKDVASGMSLPAPTCYIRSQFSLSPFSNASIATPATEKDSSDIDGTTKLSFSRAYSLALSPQLIYSLSVLLPTLVSAKVDLQLEFLALGNWWIYQDNGQDLNETAAGEDYPRGALVRVPNGREDVFADQSIDMRSKRGLTRFLRFITDFEDQPEVWQEHKLRPFTTFLTSQFSLPPSVQQPLLTLALSPSRPLETTTSFALPRVAKHLRSIGLFGPGFGAVIPKWGGLAEVAQIGCRAGAVGGGVYVLGNGIEKIGDTDNADRKSLSSNESHDRAIKVALKKGEIVSADWIIGAQDNIPWTETTLEMRPKEITSVEIVSRSISIVSSKLASLFSSTAEGSATPAGAMVVFPNPSTTVADSERELPPIHIIAHSSDTGECPEGQCVLYASIGAEEIIGFHALDRAVELLLRSVDEQPIPRVLWRLQYGQRAAQDTLQGITQQSSDISTLNERILTFPDPSLDLAFDESVLHRVKEVWQRIMGPDAEGFMQFDKREGVESEDYEDV